MSIEPPPASRAVFLSYASQDAEAAWRICEALQAAGIEVWFDQSKLAGGDAWDAKIRDQINSCALFLPLISANTQARREGYFRLEWKLAAQRTHMMSERTAFLLPIVLDATRDPAADVPGEFRAVQWTRLPGGETPAAFVARVKTLLGGTASTESARAQPSAGPGPASVATRRRSPWALAAASFAIVAAIGAALFVSKKSPPAAAPVASDRSIAVLPFTNMSDDKANAYFADGVHEDVLTNLANLRALRVISRTSMLQYRDTKKLTGQIGRELGATYVLEGSVRRAGNTVRVTGQLIRAATDEHVWAKTYDRDLKDIFAVQTELAREIATALHAVLSPAEAAQLAARPTKSVEDYDCFQKAQVIGRTFPNVRDVREKILPLLEQAVALDPDYAAAWAYLSRQHAVLYASVDRNEARLARVKDAVARAERLAPDSYVTLDAGLNLASLTRNRELFDHLRRRVLEHFSDRPEAHQMMALDAIGESRWLDAQASFRVALRIEPRNPDVLKTYFDMLRQMRRWDEAEAVGATLVEVQPDNLETRLTAASMAFGRIGSTVPLMRLLAEQPRSNDPQSSYVLVRSRIAILTGDRTDILAMWREIGPQFKTGSIYEGRTSRYMIAGALLQLGDAASARPLLEQNHEELLQQLRADPENITAHTDLCVTLGMLGDRAGARAALAKAAELIAARNWKPPQGFLGRWSYAVARSWVDEKSAVIPELGRLLREPSLKGLANVHLLRGRWETIPLQGDPDFEAMLNDQKNNAPLF